MTEYKLSESEIKLLFLFVKSKYVKEVDVQHELVDHLACAIEDEINTGNANNFSNALALVYGRFPITGFAKFVQEKEEAVKKYWGAKFRNMLKTYFTFPKIMMTACIFVVFFSIITINPITHGFAMFITTMVSLIIANIILYNKIKKKFDSKSLIVRHFGYLSMGQGLGTFYWQAYFVVNLIESDFVVVKQPIILILFSLFLTFLIIVNIAIYKNLPLMLDEEIEKKYPYLKLAN